MAVVVAGIANLAHADDATVNAAIGRMAEQNTLTPQALREKIDLVIVGSHRHGVAARLVLSNTDWQVVRRLSLGSLPAALLTLLWLHQAGSPGVRDGATIVALGVVVGFPLLTALALQHINAARSIVFVGLLPFSTAMALKMGHWGNMDCWGKGANGGSSLDMNASCSWIQYWVELDKPEDAAAYRDYLVAYSEAQRKAGRFTRPTNVRLRPVMDWLGAQKVLPADVRLQTWLAFGFLAVCVVNMVGLLLAKTLRRSGEIGVRRALGATRGDIFRQFLVEAGMLGLAGALLGLLLAQGGLWLVRQSPNDYAKLAELDASMLAVTLGLALLASLIAGLLPAWRAALVTPAVQLKVQ